MRDQYGDRISVVNEIVPSSDPDASSVHGVTVEFDVAGAVLIMCLSPKKAFKLADKLAAAADEAAHRNSTDLATAPRGVFDGLLRGLFPIEGGSNG